MKDAECDALIACLAKLQYIWRKGMTGGTYVARELDIVKPFVQDAVADGRLKDIWPQQEEIDEQS